MHIWGRSCRTRLDEDLAEIKMRQLSGQLRICNQLSCQDSLGTETPGESTPQAGPSFLGYMTCWACVCGSYVCWTARGWLGAPQTLEPELLDKVPLAVSKTIEYGELLFPSVPRYWSVAGVEVLLGALTRRVILHALSMVLIMWVLSSITCVCGLTECCARKKSPQTFLQHERLHVSFGTQRLLPNDATIYYIY